MSWLRCNDPRLRYLLLAVLAIIVFLAALILYVSGWIYRPGFLYWYAVLLLFCFALAGAIALAILIFALFKRWCQMRGTPPKGQGTREQSGPSSAYLPPTIYKRPDPLIYSQYFLMAKGLAVTWDNPDIWLTELPAADGTMAPAPSSGLLPNHTYRVHARIYNGSLEAPAVGLPVIFSFLSFGIGTVSTPIGSTIVNLPVKGALGHPQETFHDWLTPATPGHYCVQIGLFWPDDAEPGNNLGQENLSVKKLNSPNAEFRFQLRNDAPNRRRFRLEVDAYPPPEPPDCPDERPERPVERKAATWRDRIAKHRREAHPLPPNWSISLSAGNEFVLGAGEQVEVVVSVTVTEPVPVQRPINVNAFADDVFIGGVTLYVHS
jgi:hypothetical protein